MKLSECTIGTLVKTPHGLTGHIIGLEINSTHEVIALVQTATPYRHFGQPPIPNEPLGIHPANLSKLVD